MPAKLLTLLAALATLCAAGSASLAAQQRLEGRLDAATIAALRPLLDAGRRDSVPVGALEDKALEGAAKRVPPALIVAAVRQLGIDLRDARASLRHARPNASISDGEILAAADAPRRGVPVADVRALGANVAGAISLLVPLTVLGDLVQRGIPAADARRAIEELVAAGIGPEQLAEIPGRVDVALRVGAPPAEAFRSALPVPVRPPVPPAPRPGPPSDHHTRAGPFHH